MRRTSASSLRSLSSDDAESVLKYIRNQKPSATSLRFLHEIHEIGPKIFQNRAWFSDSDNWDGEKNLDPVSRIIILKMVCFFAETESLCQIEADATRCPCSILAQNDQACFDLLCALSSQGAIEWSKLVLPHFDVELLSAAEKAAALNNASPPSVSSRYFFLPLIEPEKLSVGPSISNCRIRRLCSDDAEIVDSTWRYRSPGSLSMIRGLIGPFCSLLSNAFL